MPLPTEIDKEVRRPRFPLLDKRQEPYQKQAFEYIRPRLYQVPPILRCYRLTLVRKARRRRTENPIFPILY